MERPSWRLPWQASLGVAAVAAVARPHVAKAAAKTASMWLARAFVPEQDAAFRQLVADYEKQRGNSISYSIVPFSPFAPQAAAIIL